MKPASLLGLPIQLADGSSPVSQNQARILGDQCADYWQKAAQGKLVMLSAAAPLFVSTDKVPTGSAAKLPDGNCNTAAWGFCRKALTVARAAGFNGTAPIYYIPRISCRGHGIAATNGPIYMNGGSSLQMLAHEFGHTVGLLHSGSLKMAGSSLPFDPTRALYNEYGDPYDVMGTGLSWLNPLNAQRLGVRPAPKRIPRETRTMFIKQTGQPDDTGAPRAVQITRGGPQGYTYQLSYQSPTNLDKPPVSDRIVPVRLVGGTISYYLAGLKAGKSWKDPLGGVEFYFEDTTLDGWASVAMVAP